MHFVRCTLSSYSLTFVAGKFSMYFTGVGSFSVDMQTESNHDTALTLAATGGHDTLVDLLISRGANIEHRDKKVGW